MKILVASSEAVPFSKTGGLADVCGTLPLELAKLGHEPVVIVPAHRGTSQCGVDVEPTGISVEIPINRRIVTGRLLKSHLPNSQVPVYLVEQPAYFDRDGLYGNGESDYDDNCERFVFFCRSVLEAIRALDLHVDLLHANDWQTGLIPAYLRTEYAGASGYEQIATLFTIHNLAYQGRFWHWDMLQTGLDWKYFNWRQMEFHGELNLLKTGLVFADAISTVSPRYAVEIQSAPLGCGLEAVLSHRRNVLTGIINGVDYAVWNPATDPYLAQQYDVDAFEEGKAACKQALQDELGLARCPDKPLLGVVGRLADQKGLDLIIAVMRQWGPRSAVQWAVLGTGDPGLENQLRALAGEFPNDIAVRIDFCDRMAHRIEAGADIFVMPSRYEPCGLNQLYSLKYGTVPLVRETGGLDDTVTDTNSQTLRDGTATGFSFIDEDARALGHALGRACEAYNSNKDGWRRIVGAGMQQDWSWSKSAVEYAELYEQTVAFHRSDVGTG